MHVYKKWTLEYFQLKVIKNLFQSNQELIKGISEQSICWCCVKNMLQLFDVLVTVAFWKNTGSSPQCYCFPVSSCLRSWLEQDTSCPTCRMSLNITDSHHVREDHQRENLDENLVPVAAAEGRPRLNQHNHFFHFDGELSTFDIHCCCPNKQGQQPSLEGSSVCASAETQIVLFLCLSNTTVFLMVLLEEPRCVSEVSQSSGDILKDFVQVLSFSGFVVVSSFSYWHLFLVCHVDKQNGKFLCLFLLPCDG